MNELVERARRIVGDRRFTKAARAFVMRYCASTNATLFTSDDYPRVLETLGLIERLGSGARMLGHAHELRTTELGAEAFGELARLTYDELSDEERFDLVQPRPGPSVQRAPLCWKDGRRWRLTSFGERVVLEVRWRGEVCTPIRPLKAKVTRARAGAYDCDNCEDRGTIVDGAGDRFRCTHCNPA